MHPQVSIPHHVHSLPVKALCRYYDISFSAPKKCDLLRHKQTNKHEWNVAAAKKSTKVTQFFSKANKTGMHFCKQVARAELQLAGFIIEHVLPFADANHLVEIVKKIGQLHPSVQKSITFKEQKLPTLLWRVLEERNRWMLLMS